MLREEFSKKYGKDPVEGERFGDKRVVRQPSKAVRLAEGSITEESFGKVWRWAKPGIDDSLEKFWVDDWDVVGTRGVVSGSQSRAQHRDSMRLSQD